MPRSLSRLAAVGVMAGAVLSFAQDSSPEAGAVNRAARAPEKVVVRQTADRIRIDGTLTEDGWLLAQTMPIAFIHGRGERVEPVAHARMTWDDWNVYIAIEISDTNVMSRGEVRDGGEIGRPFDVVEIFLDVSRDPQHLFEFHVTPLNVLNDLFVIVPPRGSPLHSRTERGLLFLEGWNLRDCEWAVRVDGRVNHSKSPDRGWAIEMRIPFSSLMLPAGRTAPTPGDTWRMQFVVQDGDREERHIEWSPMLEPWFQMAPETWGDVEFQP